MPNALILCVDDDPVNLAVLRQVLKADYAMVFARNGAEALTAAAKHKPSLILLDVEMPDIGGYGVCHALKRDAATASIPIIFVTARSNESDEMEGFDVGGVDYIRKPFSASIVRARVRNHLRLVRTEALEESNRDAVYMLGEAGHYNDTETGVHIWRMALYSRILAKASGWDTERCQMIELAAAMHDTGKIGLPDTILKKQGKLDAAEWEAMKTHTTIGHDILSKGRSPLFSLAAEIALHHHERWDGGGYPHGLAGTAIPEAARIVAVADVFDALSMKRRYKDAWSLDAVVTTIADEAGKHFDPQVVMHFKDALPQIVEARMRHPPLQRGRLARALAGKS